MGKEAYNEYAKSFKEDSMNLFKHTSVSGTRSLWIILLAAAAVVVFSGFWSGKTVAEDRQERLQTRDQTMQLLYKHAPEAKEMVAKSYGYAAFSNVGVNLVLLSAEGGVGVAHANGSGKNIYMNMASGGVGFGMGIKDFRAVFLFENKEVFDRFVNEGWEANAQADAAAKLADKGGAVGGAITVAPGIRLYKLTQNGLALQATIQGTKYWKDVELNK
jgi:lipid-binding SYLF domain-containing protein